MYMDPDGLLYNKLTTTAILASIVLVSPAWAVLVLTYHIERGRAPLPSFCRPQVALLRPLSTPPLPGNLPSLLKATNRLRSHVQPPW
jgi:hypothetical protein